MAALVAAHEQFFFPFAHHNTWNPDGPDIAVRDANTAEIAAAARVKTRNLAVV